MKKFALLAIVSVVLVEIILGFLIFNSFENWGDRGTFGDMFGAVNTLFSGLAFCGVIYAILMQKTELSLQREELSLTRKELERTADTALEHSKHIRKEASKAEIYRIVCSIDEKIEELAKSDISVTVQADDGAHVYSFYSVLFDLSFPHADKALPTNPDSSDAVVEYCTMEDGKIDPARVKIFETVHEISAYLKMLSEYIKEYEIIADSNVVAIYYEKRYKKVAQRLADLGYSTGNILGNT